MLELILAVSHHVLPGDWNERHVGLRYETQSNVVATAFLNSENNLSVGLGYVARHDPFFIEGGLVTGYSVGPVAPMLRVGIEYKSMRVTIAPAMTTENEFGAVFTIEHRVKW